MRAAVGMAAISFIEMPGGFKMPSLGLGTFLATDQKQIEDALNTALEVGYRHIDTAYLYQNEAAIGSVLREWFSSGKLKRDDLFITTKLPLYGAHPDRVEMFMKKSLENLQLDYVDLYLIHFPIGIKYVEGQLWPEPSTVDAEDMDHIALWKKMEEQVDAGRTKTIGLSNFNAKQVDKVLKSARIKPACLQIEMHVYLQQREVVDFCQQNEIVVVAYSPLGSPGYNKAAQAIGHNVKPLPDMLNDPEITRISEKHNKTNSQILLRYLLQKDVVPIPKSVTPARLKSNIDVYDFCLDGEDMTALDSLDIGEDARIFDCKVFKGFREHPEWPFPK